MIRHPEFRTCFQLEIGSDQVSLSKGGETVILQGHLYCVLVPHINGRNTPRQIAENLQAEMSPLHVYYGLSLLEKRGLIREASRLDEQMLLVSDLLATDPLSARHNLERSIVAVRSFSRISARDLLPILADAKIRTGEVGDFTIVLADDYLQPQLADFNLAALAGGRPWMLVAAVGASAWIGPIFTPGRPGCWTCLSQCMRQNRPEISSDARVSAKPSVLPAAASLALNLAAVQTVRWLTAGKSILDSRLLTLDSLSLKLEEHYFTPRFPCQACGGGQETRWPGTESDRISLPRAFQESHPSIALASRRRVSAGQGGYRIQAPETTFGALRHHLSAITGIVGQMTPLFEKEDEILNVYAVDLKLPGRKPLFKSPALGKGCTPVEAQISAICESLERYSILYHGDEQGRKASYESLADAAIHPNKCMLFSEAQFENREEWNSRQALQWVPKRFDHRAEIDWSPVWSLTEKAWRYVPTAYCYLRAPASRETAFCVADSNGVAAGNCVEEAILQGFFELVERDSVAIWWYNRLPRAEVDLQSFGTPYLSSLREYYSTRCRRFWVLDVTTDLGIPAFAAASDTQEPGNHGFIFGFGAHFDPAIALHRALTELNQSYALSKRTAFRDMIRRYSPTSDADSSWIRPSPVMPCKDLSSFQPYCSEDLSHDVQQCVRIAAAHDLEVLVLNQTRPGLGLEVVRVIVPGLRPWWPRFAEGRLYEVPVRMGWRDSPSTECQLNGCPIWF